MTDFKNLPLSKKAEVLLQHGQKLSSLKINGITQSLYALDSTQQYGFVELILTKDLQIHEIRLLHVNQLDKYLDDVEMDRALSRLKIGV